MQTIGLSATVAEPDDLRRWLVAQSATPAFAGLVTVSGGAKPEIKILESGERIPWAGHSAGYAMADVYALIQQFRTTLIFVNTRSQAERIFQELWRINELTLPIGLHHAAFGFTSAWRVFINDRRGAGLRAQCRANDQQQHLACTNGALQETCTQ